MNHQEHATIGFVQFAPAFGAREANLSTMARLCAEAPEADLLVLPELATSGYDFRDPDELADLAEPARGGPTEAALAEIAERDKTVLVAGYPERYGRSFYNSCMLVGPGGLRANYRKLHLFSRETELFTPGNAPPPVIETPAGRVGFMICFDWVFPETARLLALAGAQIIAHPSNLVLDFCQRAMFARSVENAVFSVTANRTGTEDRAGRSLTFTGASQILGPKGQALGRAETTGEKVGLARLRPADADDKAITPFNHLHADRRLDIYAAVESAETAGEESER